MKTKIFVMTHRQFACPRDEAYIPVQVGSALHEELGFLRDDTGSNISVKNNLYGELTGLYWAAHNVSDADYMGLCHYRRYFLKSQNSLMTAADYEMLLQRYDVILPKATIYPKSYYEVYKEAHNIEDLLVTGEELKALYPEDYPFFEEIIHGTKVFSGNLFVASSELFRQYTDWLFTIFDRVEAKLCVENYDDYHKRVFGFLSEQLLYVWVKSRNLSIGEVAVGITEEKVETTELKQKLAQLTAEGTYEAIKEALALFRTTMKTRPDVMLKASDLSGELSDMFRVLYICEGELNGTQKNKSMLLMSKDLHILVKHYRLITEIAFHIARGGASQEEIAYFRDAHISEFMLQLSQKKT